MTSRGTSRGSNGRSPSARPHPPPTAASEEVELKAHTVLPTLMAILACCASAPATDWPAWRGPDGQGHCAEKDLPLAWSKTENVRWSVPLAAKGNSTPVVSRGRVFLTQANKAGTVRGLLCFDRADGKLLWQ